MYWLEHREHYVITTKLRLQRNQKLIYIQPLLWLLQYCFSIHKQQTLLPPHEPAFWAKFSNPHIGGGGLKSFFPTCFWCASFGKGNSGGRVCCRLSPDNQPRKPDLKKWGKDVCSQATVCGATITRSCNTINHLFSPFFSAFCFSDSSVSCVDHWTGKLLLALMFCLAFIWSGGKNWKLAYFEIR
jgi:hypothetical protein